MNSGLKTQVENRIYSENTRSAQTIMCCNDAEGWIGSFCLFLIEGEKKKKKLISLPKEK